jgi:hypothetical protein
MRAFLIPKHLCHIFKDSTISLPQKGKLTTNEEMQAAYDYLHLTMGAAVADYIHNHINTYVGHPLMVDVGALIR